MSARLILLPASIVAMIGLVGCCGCDDRMQKPPIKQLDDVHKLQIEQPTEAHKSPAVLLVGKWRLVRHKSGLPAGFQATIQYTEDGKVSTWSNNPLEKMPKVQTGTYRLDGNILRKVMDGTTDDDERYRVATLVSISEERLVISGVGDGKPLDYEYEYERVR